VKVGEKGCIHCDEIKVLCEFAITSYGSTGDPYYKNVCKKCGNKNAKRTNALKKEHRRPSNGTACAVPDCDRVELVLDHDHLTGKFRGWICRQHNVALGNGGDTHESIKKLLEYLEVISESRRFSED
jgi:hypothetical protein